MQICQSKFRVGGGKLAQAANLHLLLGYERGRFFELAMPAEAYDFGTKHGHSIGAGKAVAGNRPGLGIDVLWDQLPTADFHHSVNLEFPSSI